MADLQHPTGVHEGFLDKPSVTLAIAHVGAILACWMGLDWDSDSGLGLLIGICSAFGLIAAIASTLLFSLIALGQWARRRKEKEQHMAGLLSWALAFLFCCSFSIHVLYFEGS
jgi:hypothetical protein